MASSIAAAKGSGSAMTRSSAPRRLIPASFCARHSARRISSTRFSAGVKCIHSGWKVKPLPKGKATPVSMLSINCGMLRTTYSRSFPHTDAHAQLRFLPGSLAVIHQGYLHVQGAILRQRAFHGVHQPWSSRGGLAPEQFLQRACFLCQQRGSHHMAACPAALIYFAVAAGRAHPG